MPSHDFGLLGLAGFVAPRHLRAIRDTGNRLVAACDPNDSVGVVDSYFPDARFFTEIERFDRFLEKRRIAGEPVDYLSICTPNYLHDAHVRLALRTGAHAICEKPLVLSPWNLDQLGALEERYGARVYTVLQLRLLPQLQRLREEVASSTERYSVDLRYVTPRGRWYDVSWKGDPRLSGGLPTNIGIHLFDMLLWVFGGPLEPVRPWGQVHCNEPNVAQGLLSLEKADVCWYLSTRSEDVPTGHHGSYRRMGYEARPGDETHELDFSTGFTDLHTQVYEEIFAGRGFGIEDARPAVNLAYEISRRRGLR